MAPRKRVEGTQVDNDVLLTAIADDLKKKKVAAFFIGLEETPTDLSDYISTGSSLLDLAISNRPNGGIAVGRIVSLEGMEGSGKSLICAHMIANVQREGGVAIMFDTETALNEQFAESVGVDLDKLVYVHENCVEEIFEAIEGIVERVRKSDKSKKVLIVVDSVANMSTRNELEGSYAKEGFGTEKAFLISKAMRKILPLIATQKIALVFTNQLRYKMNAPAFADPYVAPGGKAIPFSASVILRLAKVGKIKNAAGDVVGVRVKADLKKNRLGPPDRAIELEVYYDRGIDDITSWIKYLKEKGIIDGTMAKFTYVDLNGEEHTFKGSAWREFTEQNPEIFKEMYERLSDTMIMSYSSQGISTLDGSAEVDTDVTQD
jgi:recombination protein RecA